MRHGTKTPLRKYAALRFKALRRHILVLLSFCLKYSDFCFQSAHVVTEILRRTV